MNKTNNHVPDKVKVILDKVGIWDKLRRYRYRQRKISCGELNPDKTIYIIRRIPCDAGLFSYFLTIIARIEEAQKNGWIPVIDMMNYYNSYLHVEEIGKVNSWEFYFLQPSLVSLKDAYKSKNVVLSDGWVMENRPCLSQSLINDETELKRWRDVVERYIFFNAETKAYLDNQYLDVRNKAKGKILGIIVRGTDYTKMRPKGHAIQPEISDVIIKAKEVMDTYDCKNIFLATEDKEIYLEMQKEFGNEVILTNNKKWVDYIGGSINSYYDDNIRNRDKYLSGLEYLATIYILSKCDCLIGGTPGGASGAMVLSKGYEYNYFWFLGHYE